MKKLDSYYNPPEPPSHCDVCRLEVDSCICPECPECGEAGNPTCYKVGHGLTLSVEQLDARAKADTAQEEYLRQDKEMSDRMEAEQQAEWEAQEKGPSKQ